MPAVKESGPFSGISAVIPVYRGAATISELTRRLSAVLASVTTEYEILLVNDGSPDDSWEVIRSLTEEDAHVRGLNLMRNYGQHNATLCGLRKVRFPLTVTLDDDLQHPPEQIPLLLTKLEEGWDVVYGVPARRPHSWWRNLFSGMIKRTLAWVMGTRNLRDIGSFRLLRTNLRQAFSQYQNPNVILDVLLSWGTGRFASVVVEEVPRQVGRSGYDFWQLLRVALTVLTAYSTRPLRFASVIGFLVTLFGIGIFLYVLYVYFFLGSVEGFPFLASIIALFSGAQLFALGIIGEYLARVFDRSMDQPTYVIGEETGG